MDVGHDRRDVQPRPRAAAAAARPDAPDIDMVFRPEVVARLKDCGVTSSTRWVDILPILSRLARPARPVGRPGLAQGARNRLRGGAPVHPPRHDRRLLPAAGATARSARDRLLRRRDDRAAPGRRGREQRQIEYAYPEQEVTIFVDSFAIPADAPHPDAAHAFIDFAMRAGDRRRGRGLHRLCERQRRRDPAARARACATTRRSTRPPDVRARFSMGRPYTSAEERAFARAWLRMKTGH